MRCYRIFAQLRHRERRHLRTKSLFFWRDRTREVDFVGESGSRLDLFEAKWTELADESDTVNRRFAGKVMDEARYRGGGIVCRTPNAFPLTDGFRVFPVTDIE